MYADFLDTPLEESIGALDELRRAGKTKYIGLSECSAATLRKANSSKLPDRNLLSITKAMTSRKDRRDSGQHVSLSFTTVLGSKF